MDAVLLESVPVASMAAGTPASPALARLPTRPRSAYGLDRMTTRKGNGKVTETVKRLLAIEGRLGTVESAVGAVEVRVGAVEYEIRGLRADLNEGVGKLLDGQIGRASCRERV